MVFFRMWPQSTWAVSAINYFLLCIGLYVKRYIYVGNIRGEYWIQHRATWLGMGQIKTWAMFSITSEWTHLQGILRGSFMNFPRIFQRSFELTEQCTLATIYVFTNVGTIMSKMFFEDHSTVNKGKAKQVSLQQWQQHEHRIT